VYKGDRFYVMEWFEPVNLLELKSKWEREAFAFSLCEAVHWLHSKGFVHCDLKPGNIMQRTEGGLGKYVFVDFGSIHKKEEPLREDEVRKDGIRSLSVNCDRVRFYPHTPGYCDPMFDRHTIYFDIYSLGQVFRDMFAEEVPLAWSHIINKCTARQWQYRYHSVDELSNDIGGIGRWCESSYRAFKEVHDRSELERQQSLGGSRPEDFTEIGWDKLLSKSLRPRGRNSMWLWNDAVLHKSGGIHDATGEYHGVFNDRCFRIREPLVLPPRTCLCLDGSYTLMAPVIGDASSVVLLRNGVCFHNKAAQGAGGDQSVYVVASRSYLNFPPSAKGTGDNEGKDGVRARVFQAFNDATQVTFSGPGTWKGLRARAAQRAVAMALPAKFRKELIGWCLTDRFGGDDV